MKKLNGLCADLFRKKAALSSYTTNPNIIAGHLEKDLHNSAKEYDRTVPTMTNEDHIKSVCFDGCTPTLFHITERINIYQKANAGKLHEVRAPYEEESGPFSAWRFSKSHKCNKKYFKDTS